MSNDCKNQTDEELLDKLKIALEKIINEEEIVDEV